MTYKLLIGQRAYSSWSLRGWLPFDAFGIAHDVHHARIYGDTFSRDVANFAGGSTVPAAVTPDGGLLTDSLSIIWHLSAAFPDSGMLPSDPVMRAEALSLIAEMHSGFTALRGACPMNLWTSYAGFEPDDGVRADLEKLGRLLGAALDRSGGPFLHGAFGLADAYYAPIATRIATYRLPVPPMLDEYVATLLAHPSMRRWRAMALAQNIILDVYDMPLEKIPYPAPEVRKAAVSDGPSVNSVCPYSGKPVTHYLELDNRIWGFCNAFCRDKTLQDPDAWPDFLELVRQDTPNR